MIQILVYTRDDRPHQGNQWQNDMICVEILGVFTDQSKLIETVKQQFLLDDKQVSKMLEIGTHTLSGECGEFLDVKTFDGEFINQYCEVEVLETGGCPNCDED